MNAKFNNSESLIGEFRIASAGCCGAGLSPTDPKTLLDSPNIRSPNIRAIYSTNSSES